TSIMSAGLTNFNRTPRYISKKSPPHHIGQTNRQQPIKKVLEGVWGNLFLKKVSPRKRNSKKSIAYYQKIRYNDTTNQRKRRYPYARRIVYPDRDGMY
ncbi:MAG: hypothetical protein IJW81_10020, partial [Clostridia bacterium]|nr:hypothetical protein [Clostridia bacterium]